MSVASAPVADGRENPGWSVCSVAAGLERVVCQEVQLREVAREPGHVGVVEDRYPSRGAREFGDRSRERRVAPLAFAVDVEVESAAASRARLDARQVHAVACERPERRLQGARTVIQPDPEGHALFGAFGR